MKHTLPFAFVFRLRECQHPIGIYGTGYKHRSLYTSTIDQFIIVIKGEREREREKKTKHVTRTSSLPNLDGFAVAWQTYSYVCSRLGICACLRGENQQFILNLI